jgi:hypothetical protein
MSAEGLRKNDAAVHCPESFDFAPYVSGAAGEWMQRMLGVFSELEILANLARSERLLYMYYNAGLLELQITGKCDGVALGLIDDVVHGQLAPNHPVWMWLKLAAGNRFGEGSQGCSGYSSQ